MSLGVDYAAGDAKIRSKYFYTMNGNYAIRNNQDVQQNAFKTNQAQTDTFVSSLVGDVGSGNTCTDGKDDGKIGIGGVVANVAQGAVRTIPNMIKGAFTNSEGKFSLAKTALTIGIGAACVAFPAVGLALCAVGMGAGAIKAGSNVVKALNADTDAEAKAAWEHVGSGATTAALSYVGAKASYNAVEASAGGVESAMSQLKGGTFLETVKEEGIVQTAKALAKDCVSSTKANASETLSALKGIQNNMSKIALKSKQVDYEFDPAFFGDTEAASEAGSKLNILEAIKSFRTKLKSASLKQSCKNLGSNGIEIAKAIMNKDISSKSIINKFGYEKVGQVIEILAGERSADNSL